jgi:hypothetical protein
MRDVVTILYGGYYSTKVEDRHGKLTGATDWDKLCPRYAAGAAAAGAGPEPEAPSTAVLNVQYRVVPPPAHSCKQLRKS